MHKYDRDELMQIFANSEIQARLNMITQNAISRQENVFEAILQEIKRILKQAGLKLTPAELWNDAELQEFFKATPELKNVVDILNYEIAQSPSPEARSITPPPTPAAKAGTQDNNYLDFDTLKRISRDRINSNVGKEDELKPGQIPSRRSGSYVAPRRDSMFAAEQERAKVTKKEIDRIIEEQKKQLGQESDYSQPNPGKK